MATPCILIASCSDFPSENLIKDILNVNIMPDGQTVIENIVAYDWCIDTKYYTADVRLCLSKERTIGDESFAECVEAFVVYFDPDKAESFTGVKSWNSFLDHLEPDIKMLVCDRCTDTTGVTRLEAQKWCIDNRFELVELNAEVESDSETEDDFQETTGVKRIVQSLHAHTWPNLFLKDDRCAQSPYIRQLMQEEHDAKRAGSNCEQDTENNDTDATNQQTGAENCDTKHSCENIVNDKNHSTCNNIASVELDKSGNSSNTDNKPDCENCKTSDCDKGATGDNKSAGDSDDKTTSKSQKKKKVKKQTKEERLDSLLPAEDMALFETLGNEDPGGESFEKLFERFASMKEKASVLPPQDRKKYAENVAIAFWNAMGGDGDEIGDLDDSD